MFSISVSNQTITTIGLQLQFLSLSGSISISLSILISRSLPAHDSIRYDSIDHMPAGDYDFYE